MSNTVTHVTYYQSHRLILPTVKCSLLSSRTLPSPPLPSVPRNHMLQQSIDLLSYDVHSLERVSPSSGYQSPGNLSSRGGSFRSTDGGDWNPFGARGDLGMGFPAHPGKETDSSKWCTDLSVVVCT